MVESVVTHKHYLTSALSRVFEGQKLPSKKMHSFPRKLILLSLQFISNFYGKIIHTRQGLCTHCDISQNAPDCILAHIHFKKFPRGHAPGPPQERRSLRPLGTSPHLLKTINPRQNPANSWCVEQTVKINTNEDNKIVSDRAHYKLFQGFVSKTILSFYYGRVNKSFPFNESL